MMAPRTSTVASSTIAASDSVRPSARACRSRRRMFSIPTIASSTTAPMAIISPASTITLRVASRRSSTSKAAISETGMIVQLTSAIRHS